MRDFAQHPENDRRDLFRAAAQQMRVHEAIVEKVATFLESASRRAWTTRPLLLR